MQDPDSAASAAGSPPDAAQARRILALLDRDALDAAIESGLPAFTPLPALTPAENGRLLEARKRLLAAWAARERYRARAARLQRIADERARVRSMRQWPAAGIDTAQATTEAGSRPALPPAAAAALARARARATGNGK